MWTIVIHSNGKLNKRKQPLGASEQHWKGGQLDVSMSNVGTSNGMWKGCSRGLITCMQRMWLCSNSSGSTKVKQGMLFDDVLRILNFHFAWIRRRRYLYKKGQYTCSYTNHTKTKKPQELNPDVTFCS